MKPNLRAKREILRAVDNQIEANDPPETKITFNRLKEMGYSDQTAKEMIGQCIALEIFEILKHKDSFNEKRYITHLRNLPEPPFED